MANQTPITKLEEMISKIANGTLTEAEFLELRGTKEYNAIVHETERYKLLPIFFKFHGEAYTLDKYPQFQDMYSSEYVPDSMWLCGRQIGKSMNLSRSEIMDCIQIPNFQILYIAPLKPQTLRYSSLYLNEAINTCPFARELQLVSVEDSDAGPIMRNLTHKSFINNAGIQLTYAKTSSDRARGIFADRLDFDEVQDQLIDNLPIVTQSLSQSNWGLRRFTGTAKTVDNTIEALWQRSSQSEWVVKCTHCNYWNIPNMDGKVLDMIQVDGPHCVKCGGLINVRNGAFVAKYPDRLNKFVGYHIPQVVVPAIVEDPTRWSRLVNKVLGSQMPIIMQEILGISCNVGARLITQEDIDKCSCLPSVKELQSRQDDYVFTVGGVDWGIAEVTSFTVHTIVGIRADGKIDVLWAKRFAGFDPDTVLQEIAKAHTFYKCDLICCDFGMGFDKNVMLERRFGLKVIQIEYSAQKQLLNLRPILGYNRWMVDKVSALDILFWTIKYTGIRFPPKHEFDVYTQDLLSPYEEITDISGIQHRKYLRNPNLPDDFCHALCFATVGAMKLAGHTAIEMIPEEKMGTHTIAGGDLQRDRLNPAEIIQAIQ